MAYANNYQSARNLFTNRRSYQLEFASRVPEYIDFNNKRYFYGRVNDNFDPILVRGEKLKPISQEGPSAVALDFVVDAFEDMRRYFQKALALTRGTTYDGTIIDGMIVQRGWVSANNLYTQHMVNTQRVFITAYLQDTYQSQYVLNADDYVNTFFRFYERLGTPYPLTKSNFTLSGYVSPNSSGLCLEIDSAEHSSDQYKVAKYYKSPAFDEYKKIARRFGFLIDKNAPWRLVANLASPIMINYMKRYGVSNRTQLFEQYYEKVEKYDIESLRRYFIQGYNDFVEDYPTADVVKHIQCTSGPKIINQRIARRRLYYAPDLADNPPRPVRVRRPLEVAAGPGAAPNGRGPGQTCMDSESPQPSAGPGTPIPDADVIQYPRTLAGGIPLGLSAPAADYRPLRHPLHSSQKVVKDSFWLPKYYILRHAESGFAEIPRMIKAGITRAITIQKTLDIMAAVEYITNKTKTTYRKYTLPPPKEKRISDAVGCCVPPPPGGAEPPPPDATWRLAPEQGGLSPRLVPAGTQGTAPTAVEPPPTPGLEEPLPVDGVADRVSRDCD